jgi:urea transport system permease protein
MFIIAFCVGCIALMYFIIEKTKLGLLLRATTQNRTMAASLGVSTRRIDMLTFGLGAGLAGMAGCALTQVGGVTPDMGTNYIIDSFLVVVTGGVGKLAGAIWAGLGLGMTNKFLEPIFGTVWAKVMILVLVVIFIQRRPSGLFPAKGRLADA